MRQNFRHRPLADSARMATDTIAHLAGRPLGKPTAVQTADYSARLGECVLCDPSGGALAVELPRVGRADAGRVVAVKNVADSANEITIRAALPTDTVEGQQSIFLASSHGYRVLVCVGAGEWISIREPEAAATVLFAGGQNNTDSKIALFTFTGDSWEAVSGIPDISGEIVSIYARSTSDIWIVVNTASGTDRVYSYNGSSWTERTSAISNALTLGPADFSAYGVCGDDSGEDVFVVGSYDWSSGESSGTNGFVVGFDGSSFSSEWESGTEYPIYAVDVVPGGLAFARGPTLVLSNRGGSWGTDGTIGSGGTPKHGIRAFSDDSVITHQWYLSDDGYLHEYDGSWGNTYVTDGGGMALDGLSPDDYWCCAYPSNGDQVGHIVNQTATVYDSGDNPWSGTTRDVLVVGENDVWVCGDYDGVLSTPVLSHWDGSNWSDETSYGVGDIGYFDLLCLCKTTG